MRAGTRHRGDAELVIARQKRLQFQHILRKLALVAGERAAQGAGQDFDALSEAAKKKGFKPVPLTGVKASFSFDNEISKKMSRNVKIGRASCRARVCQYV